MKYPYHWFEASNAQFNITSQQNRLHLSQYSWPPTGLALQLITSNWIPIYKIILPLFVVCFGKTPMHFHLPERFGCGLFFGGFTIFAIVTIVGGMYYLWVWTLDISRANFDFETSVLFLLGNILSFNKKFREIPNVLGANCSNWIQLEHFAPKLFAEDL